MDGSDPLGQAGYAVTGSGGGGTGGQFVFADLDELQAIIAEAETLLEEMRQDGEGLLQAQALVRAPAQDAMSVMEADATLRSLAEAVRHNRAMADYVQAEVAKLRACRDAYLRSNDEGAVRFRAVDEG